MTFFQLKENYQLKNEQYWNAKLVSSKEEQD